MKKNFLLILLITALTLYLPIQSVYSYNGNVQVIKETNKEKFDSLRGEEILIILDSSSALSNKNLANTAVSAVYSILNSLPSDARVGLRVFGAASNTSGHNCNSSQLVVPVSASGRQLIANKLSSISNFNGASAVTLSLKNAIENDFASQNTTKHIILISGNNDTCNNNPCSYINSILQFRSNIIIDVIALGVDINSSSQLKCLANSTGGQYIPVRSDERFSLNVNTTVVYMDDENNSKDNRSNETEQKYPPPSNNKVKYTNYMFEFSH